RILNRIPGTSVVYVRNRKRCREIAQFLESQGISASYYHAGLDAATRALRQQAWIDGRIRVIVCTNAFGMGIDKPDVRTVIHMDLPDTPEAYFQEAGRAGRDELPAWAVLLNDPADLDEAMERFSRQWPGFDTVKAVYNWIGNYLQIPVGAGEGQSYPFQLSDFISKFKIHPIECLNAIKFIESEGLLSFNENLYTPARLMFSASRDDVYDFELKNPVYEPIIKTILRSYGGAFNDFIVINESDIASRSGIALPDIRKALINLHKKELIKYFPPGDEPRIYFPEGRYHPERLPLSINDYNDRKKASEKRFKKMLDYSQESSRCRSKSLISYFGEKHLADCGICDVCIEKSKAEKTSLEEIKLYFKVSLLIKNGINRIEQILAAIPGNPEKTIEALRICIDEGKVKESPAGTLELSD
ncbi:MAG: RecQ family ATP-dependent DNA helicase, partial [Bacteroidetes bacterium]|nr:RecQ family ATP-dependent DNA helicase [Bacteroidota bacterium]